VKHERRRLYLRQLGRCIELGESADEPRCHARRRRVTLDFVERVGLGSNRELEPSGLPP